MIVVFSLSTVAAVHTYYLTRVCFRNYCNKTGIQIKCANGQLIKESGVGDVSIPNNVSLVTPLKINLIFFGKLALTGYTLLHFIASEKFMINTEQDKGCSYLK